MNFIKLLNKIKKKIAKDFRHANTQGLIFHNLNRIKKVVKYTAGISEHYQLEPDKHFCVRKKIQASPIIAAVIAFLIAAINV